MRVRESGLDGMLRYFRDEVPAQVEETKNELRALVTAYSERVAAQVPLGPSHRKQFKEGDLRRSVDLEEHDHGMSIEWIGTVGRAPIDYERYANARDGVDFLAGFGEMAHAGHEVMAGHHASVSLPARDYRDDEVTD